VLHIGTRAGIVGGFMVQAGKFSGGKEAKRNSLRDQTIQGNNTHIERGKHSTPNTLPKLTRTVLYLGSSIPTIYL
jgi:hypothetical protein